MHNSSYPTSNLATDSVSTPGPAGERMASNDDKISASHAPSAQVPETQPATNQPHHHHHHHHHEELQVIPIDQEAIIDAEHIDLSWRSWVRFHSTR